MPELTQRQIARLSSVSQATVSRVLNNDPRVNEEVRDRVLAIVRSHDYVPDSRAQSLRAQRSGTVGLVVHRTPEQLAQDPFFCALIVAILQVGNARGYHLCVDTERTLSSQRTVHEELLRTRRVDGLILVESTDYDERIAWLIEKQFPFALIGRYGANDTICSVDNDNVAAGRMVTNRLIADGHCRIAYVGGPEGVNVSEDRKAGYLQALATHGLDVAGALIRHGDFTDAGGYRAMQELIAARTIPDAVVGVDDLTTVGAMRAARAYRLSIPGDVAFVGFNDSPFCSHLDTPLSSVSIDISELARLATEMLIDQIDQRAVAPGRRIVPCRLIERATTRNL